MVVWFFAPGTCGRVGGGLCSGHSRSVRVYVFGACLGRDYGGFGVALPDLCACMCLARLWGGTMAGDVLQPRRKTARSGCVRYGTGVGLTIGPRTVPSYAGRVQGLWRSFWLAGLSRLQKHSHAHVQTSALLTSSKACEPDVSIL